MTTLFVLTTVASVCVLGGLALFAFWVFSTSIHYANATDRWFGIVGIILLIVGILTMIPSICLEQKFNDFEVGQEEFVEYKTTPLGTNYAERLVVSEDTAEALGRIKVGN